MSAQVDAPEVYLLGVEDGKREAGRLAVARLLTAEDLVRRYQDELDETRASLERERQRARRLRAQLANPIVIALRWSAIASLLTALAVFNLCANGWQL